MSADDQRAAEAEYERLRTELAETRTVGDALAAAVTTWLTQGPDGPMGKTMLCPLVDVWNEVRGDAPAPAEPPAEPRELAFREDDLAEGMQRAWNDVVGDVGHIPEEFTVRPRTAQVTADFLGGPFARSVLGYLRAIEAARGGAR